MLEQYFRHGMDKAVIVFDGLTNKLKKEKAHVERYHNRQAKQAKLQELYKKTSFENIEDEKAAIARVRKLQKALCPMRADIIFSIKDKVVKKFGATVKCIGSPFEADHQLAGLFHQGIIDFTVTVDSDLVCLGSDVLIDFDAMGKCWSMSLRTLLDERLPSKFGTNNNITWTKDILHHVACFLGNDYVRRVPGNGPKKVKSFVEAIAPRIESQDHDGLYEMIKTFMVDTSTKSSQVEKEAWHDPARREQHIGVWKKAHAMFEHGPAFFVISKRNGRCALRNDFFDGEYEIVLGSYSSGESTNWFVDHDKHQLTLGYNPSEDLFDALDETTFDYLPSVTGDERKKKLFRECFELERWSDKGQPIVALQPPRHRGNNMELYHGSIIDFSSIPEIYIPISSLKFWLECRQVKPPSTAADIRALVKLINSSHKDALDPIPKELMRGVSGWINEEILTKRDDRNHIEWIRGDEFISTIVKINPCITDDQFTNYFGKRNGSRFRCLKHVQGGSFNLATIKGTLDMTHKLDTNLRLFTIEASCAPSQKLKEDNKDAFHNLRLCIELDHNGNFKKYCNHPLSTCGCPNGCIPCAHKGAKIILINSILQFCKMYQERENDDAIASALPAFDMIEKHYPPPVHEILKLPVATEYAWPSLESKRKLSQNQYVARIREDEKQQDGAEDEEQSERNVVPEIFDEEDNDRARVEMERESTEEIADLQEYIHEENENSSNSDVPIAIPGTNIADNSIQMHLQVIEKISKWTTSLFDGRDHHGRELKTAKDVEKYTAAMANHFHSKPYLAAQLKFLRRLQPAIERKINRDNVWKSSQVSREADNNNANNSNDRKKTTDDRLPPILYKLLQVTEDERKKMESELGIEYSDECVNLKKLVRKDF